MTGKQDSYSRMPEPNKPNAHQIFKKRKVYFGKVASKSLNREAPIN